MRFEEFLDELIDKNRFNFLLNEIGSFLLTFVLVLIFELCCCCVGTCCCTCLHRFASMQMFTLFKFEETTELLLFDDADDSEGLNDVLLLFMTILSGSMLELEYDGLVEAGEIFFKICSFRCCCDSDVLDFFWLSSVVEVVDDETPVENESDVDVDKGGDRSFSFAFVDRQMSVASFSGDFVNAKSSSFHFISEKNHLITYGIFC